MVLLRRNAWLLGACYALVAGLMLWSVFRTPAFLHGEMIGQAFFWNHPNGNFFQTLFDPRLNQEYAPGRFRYVEYLAEAVYWKAVGSGFLPKDLHDYAAVAVTALIAVLLILLARQQRLSRWATFLCVTFFLWGVPTFMVQAWHYRKAKYLVSLLLLLFAWRAGQKKEGRWDPWLSVICALGVLTDPYFILMAPLLAGAQDVFVTKGPRLTISLMVGFAVGAVLVVLLNGVIGPQFSALCGLVGTDIPGKSWQFLNPAHIPAFHYILPDLFGPFVVFKAAKILRPIVWCLLLLAGLIGMLRFSRRHPQADFSLVFALLASLPVAAYLVFPAPQKGIFGMYYGHPLFVLFVMAWINLLGTLQKFSGIGARAVATVTLMVVIGCHVAGQKLTFDFWVQDHLGKAEQKFVADTENISRLRRALAEESTTPVYLDLDYSQIFYKQAFPCCYHLVDVGQAHTNIAYYLYPVLFKQEIASGRLQIRAR